MPDIILYLAKIYSFKDDHANHRAKKELNILKELYEATEAQFLTIYGRRGIGKTFLIHEFFKNKGLYFEITGIKEGSTKEQLFHFSVEFCRLFNQNDRLVRLNLVGNICRKKGL